MMIFLFSQSRAVLIALEALTFLFMMTRIYDGASALGTLLVFLIGSVIAVLVAGFFAGMLHHRLLLVLYSLKRPDDFIRLYEPLLSSKWIPSNVRFTINAYLSNGYAAKGDFARARELLDNAPQISKRRKTDCDLILCGNRANIALFEGAAKEAEAQLQLMEQLIASGAMDAQKRTLQQAILKTLCAQLHILSGECHMQDCDMLREESKKPGSALRRTELSYFIGKAYMLLNQPALAKEYLEDAAASKELHAGRLAANALSALASASKHK
ncbi:MAG: hypothetical protein IKV90_11060 [Clostridia bacterium]|nr:hypothetical protein [Clostridia bacterium]